MTLIAGFRFNNGVLLCSDTQMEQAVRKTDGPKMCIADFAGGTIAFTFAGNCNKAQAAIQACARRLKALTASDDVFGALEQVLEVQYRRLVHKDPEYPKDFGIHYWLVISAWIRERNRTYLWMTNDVTLTEVQGDLVCAGIGLELGHYIADPIFSRDMDAEQALFVATYMMSRAASAVQGIGGMSHYFALNDDGAKSPIMGRELDEGLKEHTKGWDVSKTKALIEVATKGNPARQAVLVREFSLMNISAIQYWQMFIHGDPSISQYLQSTKASASRPQPSPG